MHRDFRKPLVIMSPKALLRHPKCKSRLDEFDDIMDTDGAGTRFKRVIKDKNALELEDSPPPKPEYKSLVFCSGKVYYDLDAEREALGLEKEVAIVRVEQLAPLPWDLIMREFRRYPNAKITWCQEEAKNMGGFPHMLPRLQTALKEVGRDHDINVRRCCAALERSEERSLCWGCGGPPGILSPVCVSLAHSVRHPILSLHRVRSLLSPSPPFRTFGTPGAHAALRPRRASEATTRWSRRSC